jgi:hydrogenase expression/formation protein HypD
MKYLDEFRDAALARQIIERIQKLSANLSLRFMEVCGSHTVAIYKAGIKGFFPGLDLISGPGCPVCVTSTRDIDRVIHLARTPDTIVTTFGDMIRVPGSYSSLQKEISQGAEVRIVYSPLDSLRIARENPARRVVFLAVGFETTAPAIAATILQAEREGHENFSILSYHKVIPPAMRALLAGEEVRIDGFICPGHVSTIIGARPYQFIPEEYHLPAVITGFEPLDILQALLMLVVQIREKRPCVEIQYSRVVKPEGNPLAVQKLKEVFQPADAEWRGLGVIPDSGLILRQQFEKYDATCQFDLSVEVKPDPPGCQCGLILKGLKKPAECPLFDRICNPQHPVGPCMVSAEGSCAAAYKYGRGQAAAYEKSQVTHERNAQ